jgi:hypothetical protein
MNSMQAKLSCSGNEKEMNMFKNLHIAVLLYIAVLFVAILAGFGVHAGPGIPPLPSNGPGLVDGTWLNGLAGGQNFTYQSGLTALGSTQATATQLPAGVYLMEVDTAGSGGATGVALPTCVQGTVVYLLNYTAYTIDVYPAIANNQLLSPAAQDVISSAGSIGTTSTTETTYTTKTYVCAKTGIWAAK